MEWILLNYECFTDPDDYTVIDVTFRTEDRTLKPLQSVQSFIDDIRKSYPDEKGLERQALVDIPRQECSVNGIKCESLSAFIKEIGYSQLVKEALALSTQASMFPVMAKLFAEYRKLETQTHVTDFQKNNPLVFKLWSLGQDRLRVEISKKFRIIHLDDESNPLILKTLQTNITLELGTQLDQENATYSVVETETDTKVI